jgi:hypothetical protein
LKNIPTSFVLEAGEVDNHWSEFGLAQVGINLRGNPTGFKMICKDAEPVNIVSDKYVLIPNEYALRAADDAAKILGAVPFSDFDGPWFCKTQEHVMMNKERTQMIAMYAWQDAVDFGNGDKIHIGYSIRNGIDGVSAFGVGMWTFRNACSNMFFMMRVPKWGHITETGAAFDDRQLVSWLWKIHLGSNTEELLEKKQIAKVIENVMKSGKGVIERIRQMKQAQLTEAQANMLIKGVPLKYLKEISGFDVQMKAGTKSKVDFTGDVTQYQVWNDLTDLLTHDSKGAWDTKMTQYAVVQATLFNGGK